MDKDDCTFTEVSHEEEGASAIVITPEDRILSYENVASIRKMGDRYLQGPYEIVVLDLSETTHLDVSVEGTLIQLSGVLRTKGKKLVLVLSRYADGVLTGNHIKGMFVTADTVEDAVLKAPKPEPAT